MVTTDLFPHNVSHGLLSPVPSCLCLTWSLTRHPPADALAPPLPPPLLLCAVFSTAGVFFVYDVSPFMVEVIPAERTPFSHLLIRLCAVAGGAFAVSGLVDSAVFYVSNRLRRQGLLGK